MLPSALMKILLRHTQTRRFYRPQGCWTDRLDEALSFAHTGQALQRAYELKGDDLEILLAFEDPHFNITLPLRPTG